MEPSSEQKPAKKQHQTACAAVSQKEHLVFYLYLILCASSAKLKQTVLHRSGMLEQGVDRIVAQVVDPKINHLFRPQVERVVREFLSPGSCAEEPPAPQPSIETKPDSSIPEQGTQHDLCVVVCFRGEFFPFLASFMGWSAHWWCPLMAGIVHFGFLVSFFANERKKLKMNFGNTHIHGLF